MTCKECDSFLVRLRTQKMSESQMREILCPVCFENFKKIAIFWKDIADVLPKQMEADSIRKEANEQSV
jgi:hypothetical protein